MPMANIRRLGTSSDAKNYIYGHESGNNKMQTLQPSSSLPEAERTSLMNASKLVYNPINLSSSSAHPKVHLLVTKWNNAYKIGPLSR